MTCVGRGGAVGSVLSSGCRKASEGLLGGSCGFGRMKWPLTRTFVTKQGSVSVTGQTRSALGCSGGRTVSVATTQLRPPREEHTLWMHELRRAPIKLYLKNQAVGLSPVGCGGLTPAGTHQSQRGSDFVSDCIFRPVRPSLCLKTPVFYTATCWARDENSRSWCTVVIVLPWQREATSGVHPGPWLQGTTEGPRGRGDSPEFLMPAVSSLAISRDRSPSPQDTLGHSRRPPLLVSLQCLQVSCETAELQGGLCIFCRAVGRGVPDHQLPSLPGPSWVGGLLLLGAVVLLRAAAPPAGTQVSLDRRPECAA